MVPVVLSIQMSPADSFPFRSKRPLVNFVIWAGDMMSMGCF